MEIPNLRTESRICIKGTYSESPDSVLQEKNKKAKKIFSEIKCTYSYRVGNGYNYQNLTNFHIHKGNIVSSHIHANRRSVGIHRTNNQPTRVRAREPIRIRRSGRHDMRSHPNIPLRDLTSGIARRNWSDEPTWHHHRNPHLANTRLPTTARHPGLLAHTARSAHHPGRHRCRLSPSLLPGVAACSPHQQSGRGVGPKSPSSTPKHY